MRDRKFYDRAKDAILLTLTDGSHVTVEQYSEKAKADGHVAPAEEGQDPVVTVYYTTDRELQAQYIALFETQGIQIAVLDKLIDTQFVQMLESYDATVKFQRIDADPAAALKADGDVTENQTLVELFRKASGNDKLEVRFEALKDASLPAMLTVSEQSRRMEEMMKLYSQSVTGMTRDIMWPSLISIVEKGKLKMTCFMQPQADYEDGIEPDTKDMIFYLKQMKEQKAEAGLSLEYKNAGSLREKLDQDADFFQKSDSSYKYGAAFAEERQKPLLPGA